MLPIDANLHALFQKGRLYTYTRGEVVQDTEDESRFNFISSGYIKRYLISNSGELGIQFIYGPGDVFSLTRIYKLLLNQEIYTGNETYYYEAMGDVEIYTISTELLSKEAAENPLLYKSLFKQAGRRIRSALNGLENVSQRVAYNKVAHRLWYYSMRFGKETKSGVKIMVPLTQQDLADILSLTRETVSLCIAELRKKGLIKTSRKHITVPDQKKLEKVAFS